MELVPSSDPVTRENYGSSRSADNARWGNSASSGKTCGRAAFQPAVIGSKCNGLLGVQIRCWKEFRMSGSEYRIYLLANSISTIARFER